MRVRISYSVDMEEVPKESQRLLQNAVEALHQSWTELQSLQLELEEKMTDAGTKAGVLSLCEDIRKRIAAADSKILDASMIIGGYYQALENPPEPVGQAEEEVSDVSEG